MGWDVQAIYPVNLLHQVRGRCGTGGWAVGGLKWHHEHTKGPV